MGFLDDSKEGLSAFVALLEKYQAYTLKEKSLVRYFSFVLTKFFYLWEEKIGLFQHQNIDAPVVEGLPEEVFSVARTSQQP